MKKLFIITLLLAVGVFSANAQEFAKGKSAINAGIGLGSGYYSGSYYSFTFGMNASYEMGIVEVPMGSKLKGVVGVGGQMGYSTHTFSNSIFGGDYKIHYNSFLIAARGTYHFVFMDKFDPYAGVFLGYEINSHRWTGSVSEPADYNYDGSSFRPGLFVGARYMFTDNFGVYAELGYMLTVFNCGVSFEF